LTPLLNVKQYNKKTMKKLFYLLIASVLLFASCENNDSVSDLPVEEQQSPLSVEKMKEFGITSIEPITSSNNNKSSDNCNNEEMYLLKYIGSDNKSIIRILPNNEFEIDFFDKEEELVYSATVIVDNINESGYVDGLLVDSNVKLKISKDNYVINTPNQSKGYYEWANCVGDAVTACYTEDLGCAAMFTVVFPFAFSAVMLACI